MIIRKALQSRVNRIEILVNFLIFIIKYELTSRFIFFKTVQGVQMLSPQQQHNHRK